MGHRSQTLLSTSTEGPDSPDLSATWTPPRPSTHRGEGSGSHTSPALPCLLPQTGCLGTLPAACQPSLHLHPSSLLWSLPVWGLFWSRWPQRRSPPQGQPALENSSPLGTHSSLPGGAGLAGCVCCDRPPVGSPAPCSPLLPSQEAIRTAELLPGPRRQLRGFTEFLWAQSSVQSMPVRPPDRCGRGQLPPYHPVVRLPRSKTFF